MKPDWILEDYELGLKMLKHYGKIYNLPEVLLLYRIHDDQITNKYNTESMYNEILRKQMLKEILLTN